MESRAFLILHAQYILDRQTDRQVAGKDLFFVKRAISASPYAQW
jgi:hypothetical protein